MTARPPSLHARLLPTLAALAACSAPLSAQEAVGTTTPAPAPEARPLPKPEPREAGTPAPAAAETPAAAATGDGEIITLAPFVIPAGDEDGYVAQNTLSGSRLRTEIKDIAAAISPMTQEFLQDIAATNIVEASNYGVNSRVETDDGRAAGPVGDQYNDAFREIRVRGLPGGSRTVNFFKALGEVDSYNTQRIEFSRGPNSILYGFGSPAGVINASSKVARLDQQVNSVSLRVDDWDGWRSVVDVNVPIVGNRSAVRAIWLHGEEGSWRNAGHNDQDRFYLTGTWQIDRKTSITAEFEHLEQDRFVPRPFFGVDQMSVWEAAGRPSFNNFNLALAPGAVGTPGNPFRDTGATAVTGVEEIASTPYVVWSDATGNLQNYNRFTRSERANPISNDFVRGLINPEAVLEANWVNGQFDYLRYAGTLQRELMRGLYLELGASHQELDSLLRNLSSWDRYGVTADPNLYFPDGTPKDPSDLYYFETKTGVLPRTQDLDQLRATLSYEKQMADIGWLRLAALFELSLTENRAENLEEHWMNSPSLTSGGAFNADPLNSANRVYYRHYLPSLDAVLDPGYRLPGPVDLSGGVPYRDPATGVTRTIYANLINRAQGNIDFWDEQLQSSMIVGQFITMRSLLAITAGYREDTLRRYENDAIRDPAGIAAGNAGIWLPVDPPDAPTAILKGDTFTVGAVAHVTPVLSLFANTSSSVNIPGDVRVFGADPTNPNPDTFAPLRDGETFDYGIKLNLLDRKLFATLTRFDTEARNDTGFSGFTARGDIVQIWRTLSEAGTLPAADAALASQMFQYTNRTQGYLLDAKTEGYELEITGQLRPGWSVSVNFSVTESVRSNIAREVRAHIEQWKPLWLRYRDYNLSQSTSTPGAELRPFEDFRTQAEILATGDFTVNTDSINERIVDLETNFFNNPFAFEGNRFIGDNKDNLNVRTRYSIRKGPLRGLTVGGGMRFRNGRVAGAIPEFTFLPGSTYTDLHNGREITGVRIVEAEDETYYDLLLQYNRKIFDDRIGMTIQLNVDNVFDKFDLIVNNTNPRTGAPTTYRYGDPRKIILTTTLTF